MDAILQIKAASDFIKSRCGTIPPFAIVLGSGLNPVAEALEPEVEIEYRSIPHCPKASVAGHAGKLLIGKLGAHRIAVMQGRMHCYEGHSPSDVVFLFRALGMAGIKVLCITNAAGGLHKELTPGDFVLISDHINMMGINPLIGANLSDLGPRFPDLNNLYDEKLRECFLKAARTSHLELKQGVYVGLLGPSYETPTEVRMYHRLGGDVVGMSSIPEAIAMRHMKVRVVALSCVTNLAAGVSDTPANHEEVLETGKKSVAKFNALLTHALDELKACHAF